MTGPLLRVLWAAVCLGSLVLGCRTRCDADSVEDNGVCVPRCNAPNECPFGKSCVEGVCRTSTTQGGSSGMVGSSSAATVTTSSSNTSGSSAVASGTSGGSGASVSSSVGAVSSSAAPDTSAPGVSGGSGSSATSVATSASMVSSSAASSGNSSSSAAASSSSAGGPTPAVLMFYRNSFLLSGGELIETENLGTTVNPSHSILFMSHMAPVDTPACSTITGRLEVASAVFTRASRCTGSNDTSVAYTVVEFNDAVTVQRGTAVFQELTDPPSRVITLATPVDPANSFILLYSAQDGGAFTANDLPAAYFNDSNSFTLDISDPEDAMVDWQVVSMAGARVQHQTVTLTQGQNSGSGTPVLVDNTRAWLVYHVATTTNVTADMSSALVAGQLVGDTPQFQRSASATAVTIHASIIELPAPFSTERGETTLNDNTFQLNHASHPADATVVVGGGMLRGGRGVLPSLFSAAAVWLRLEPRTDIRAELKRHAAAPETTLPWTVLRF